MCLGLLFETCGIVFLWVPTFIQIRGTRFQWKTANGPTRTCQHLPTRLRQPRQYHSLTPLTVLVPRAWADPLATCLFSLPVTKDQARKKDKATEGGSNQGTVTEPIKADRNQERAAGTKPREDGNPQRSFLFSLTPLTCLYLCFSSCALSANLVSTLLSACPTPCLLT